jgi:hypothetical protein
MSGGAGFAGASGSYHCGKADWSKEEMERPRDDLNPRLTMPQLTPDTKQQVVVEEQTKSKE